ncbi:MAG: hypothetical protein JWQ28_1640 [Pedobacter sp.]|jgi:hypothetical protein|nr:hypothetical protein [Pedobacter sp.]
MQRLVPNPRLLASLNMEIFATPCKNVYFHDNGFRRYVHLLLALLHRVEIVNCFVTIGKNIFLTANNGYLHVN